MAGPALHTQVPRGDCGSVAQTFLSIGPFLRALLLNHLLELSEFEECYMKK